MKPRETGLNQKLITPDFTVNCGPRPAPAHIVRQVESEAQALEISIRAGRHKLDYIAACIGKKRSYVSRMQNGSCPIPDKLVNPLCVATGTNLLQQFIDLHDALNGPCPVNRLAESLRAA